jgi:hypothetical protein
MKLDQITNKRKTINDVNQNDEVRGAHEWLLEFETLPTDMNRFRQVLDDALRKLNSDYDAKRTADIALAPPKLRVLENGAFEYWLKSKGKLGGQHKIPRLSNDRKIIDDILAICETKV